MRSVHPCRNLALKDVAGRSPSGCSYRHRPIMTPAVAELESYLQSMLALEPPGASGSMVYRITTLCTANVQVRDILLLSSHAAC